MKKEQKMTPELRFKGFSDPWEQRKLGELVKRVTRKNKNLESSLPLTISAQYGLVDQNSFFNKQIASKDVSGYYLLKKGEFAYNKSYSNGYPWGAVKRLEKYELGVLSTLYICFKPTDVNSDFLASYYDTNRWYKEVSKHAAEGARNHGLLNIAASDFFETELTIPREHNEQKEIASFFQQLDHTITLHQRKLDALKQMKKGFLQVIFPENGENRPKLRFADFDREWEQRKFSDFTKISQGLQIAISERFLTAGKNRLSYITNEFLNPNASVKYYIENAPKSVIADEDDILMTRTGNTGKVVTDVHGAFHNNFFKISYEKSKINKLFLYFLLNSDYVQNEIRIGAGSSTIPDLKHPNFYKIKVKIPTFEEQHQIGTFFQQLDQAITLHQKKIDTLQQLKKYFLKNMFI